MTDSATAIKAAFNEVRPRCRRCDYALESLAPDARCPECGLNVLESELPRHFRFRSWQTIARVRSGLGCLVSAVLVSTLINIGFTFQCMYWLQLRGTPWQSWLVRGVQIWWFGTLAAETVVLLAMMAVLSKSMRRASGPQWRLARVTLGCAALALLSLFLERFVLEPMWSGTTGLPAVISVLLAAPVAAAPIVATTCFLAWLTCCIERSRAPWLWMVLAFATAGSGLWASFVAIRQFCLNTGWLTHPGGWAASAGSWEVALSEIDSWIAEWQPILGNAGRAVALAGILVFLIKLPRRSSAE